MKSILLDLNYPNFYDDQNKIYGNKFFYIKYEFICKCINNTILHERTVWLFQKLHRALEDRY